MKTEVIVFNEVIQPNSSKLLTERLKDNGTIIELRVRFYAGVEKDLVVMPYLSMTGQRREDLLTYAGVDKQITGDDDYFVFPVQLDFKMDDEMAVYVENQSTDFAYTLMCFVVVQYDFEVTKK